MNLQKNLENNELAGPIGPARPWKRGEICFDEI